MGILITKTAHLINLRLNVLYFLAVGMFSLSAYSTCPEQGKNESPEDCPWAEITREIIDQNKSCDQILKKKSPFIFNQFKKDKSSHNFISLWGEAKNFDDNAKAVIVDKKIIECLAKNLNLKSPLKQQIGFESVHAGLQHTYSYLFSNILTPYGYKRARWTGGDMQRGFLLSHKTLTPETDKGAFLSNVTYFFSKFAFREDTALIKKLETSGIKNKSVSPEFLEIKPESYEIKNLRESLPKKNIILHTTFVKMNPKELKSKNTHLLIYWVEDTKSKTKLLITGFPVEQGFVTKALDVKNLGLDKPIVPRYNAWISELANLKEPLSGLREIY